MQREQKRTRNSEKKQRKAKKSKEKPRKAKKKSKEKSRKAKKIKNSQDICRERHGRSERPSGGHARSERRRDAGRQS